MSNDVENWTADAAAAISDALNQLRKHLNESIAVFAIDCHPWNGTIALCVLTARELYSDSALADPKEMAAWEHYDFASDAGAGAKLSQLGRSMRSSYENAIDKKTVAIVFLLACAAALQTSLVRESLATFELADGFRVTIPHPDTDDEFASEW